jgi:lipid II:glycine glycyltransferase (peptidoglycan interpeptide bridge formation enzyme)
MCGATNALSAGDCYAREETVQDIWDRWQQYHEIAQLELVVIDLDLLTAQLNEAQAEAKRLQDMYSMKGVKPNKEGEK